MGLVVPSGGLENPSPGQCKCEYMEKVPALEDAKEKYQCKKVQSAAKCLSPGHNLNNNV